ncbi:MAG TPA: TolC family protein [Terriglobales bacterium]|nr:TolC family protein [Terriglobales bacterium]
MKPAFTCLLKACLICLFTLQCLAAPLDFRTAVKLAAEHSAAVAIAAADQEKARAAYLEVRDAYLPQVVAGSGLGYTAGFPLSMEGAAPSIFNVTSQQFLVNPAQKWLARSAKAQWNAAVLAREDQRKQAIMDAALAYAELAKVTSQLQALVQQEQSAQKLVSIESDRVRAGIDNPVLLTRAKLDEARTRMRSAELEGSALELRTQLAELTGLPLQEIEPVTDSIPALPDDTAIDAAAEAVGSSEKIKVANEQSQATELRARAEHRQNWPALDFVSQYALLAKFNNYETYYKAFQRNNVTVGVAIRFPFLNFSQNARAREADADAVKAARQAEVVRSQVATEAVKLQTAARQLAAGRDVAQYDYELARAQTSATEANVEAGRATISDQMSARLAEQQKFDSLLDATFQLQKVEIQLLRATGELENWALARDSTKN